MHMTCQVVKGLTQTTKWVVRGGRAGGWVDVKIRKFFSHLSEDLKEMTHVKPG